MSNLEQRTLFEEADMSVPCSNAERRLYELSINAFETITHARMSELPIAAEISRYEQKILRAACAARPHNAVKAHNAAQPPDSELELARRKAADAAASDRGDPDARVVLEAAYKVWHEIHRLMGLLRFCPNEDGVYIARCEPDHCVLPALGPHFTERFGQTPWAIIDEKRRMGIRRIHAREDASFEFFNTDELRASSENSGGGEWENLWRRYHKTINNENRNNPDLQRSFMPTRYWKYVTELS